MKKPTISDKNTTDSNFLLVDELTLNCIARSLRGKRVASFARQRNICSTQMLDMSDAERSLIDAEFQLGIQESRGAWFLPEEAKLRVGLLNFPNNLRSIARYASRVMEEEQGKFRLADTADCLFIWSVLEPLADALYQPLLLRGPLAGTMERDEHIAAWQNVERTYMTLGLPIDGALSKMHFGCGWSKLRASEQLDIKRQLVQDLKDAVSIETIRAFRDINVQPLIDRFNQKAKRQNTLMRQVLTKSLQKVLSGYFGGDWLRFLAYMNADPHPDEHIASTLPQTVLYVEADTKVLQVVKETGIPLSEVERMLASVWGQSEMASPVQRRVNVMIRYWECFDIIHAQQVSGMRPLWGLIDDGPGLRLLDEDENSAQQVHDYTPGLYRDLLPQDLQDDIAILWGTSAFRQWPERLITTISPHESFAQAFGPALDFWHGCALTAWFICEGPYSRTDLRGMQEYYKDKLLALDSAGTPVDPALFTDMLNAGKYIGKKSAPDSGFGLLRDVVTSYRRIWAMKHLESYIRSRWETQIRESVRRFYRLMEQKAKAPSAKQFLQQSIETVNQWFGGDVSALYSAFGEKSPLKPTYHRLMPDDPMKFIQLTFNALGGERTSWSKLCDTVRNDEKRSKIWEAYSSKKTLAEMSIRYLQLREAIGHPPKLGEFGRSRLQWCYSALDKDIEKAWEKYKGILEQLIKSTLVHTQG